MFSSIANAADAGQQASNPIMGMLPIVIIFVIFYFLIIRPQSKRAKEEKSMRDALQIGNKVVTLAGILGTVTEIDDAKSVVSISIAKDVEIVILKSAIAEVLKEDKEVEKKESKSENKTEGK